MWHSDAIERTAPWNLWAVRKWFLFISPGLDGVDELLSLPQSACPAPSALNPPLYADDTHTYIP